MGMIDVEVPDPPYLSPWLSKMKSRVCGTYDISGLSSIGTEQNTFATAGTDVLTVVRAPGVDKKHIILNNVRSVEKHYGIEAAAEVLRELISGSVINIDQQSRKRSRSEIISDFMARECCLPWDSKDPKRIKNMQ